MSVIAEAMKVFTDQRKMQHRASSNGTGIKKLVESVRSMVEDDYQDDPEEGAEVLADVPADEIQRVLGLLAQLEQAGIWELEDLAMLSGAVKALQDSEVEDEDIDEILDALVDLAEEMADEGMDNEVAELADAITAIDDFYFGEDEEEDYEDEDYEADVGGDDEDYEGDEDY